MFKKYVSAISICLLLVLMSTSAANAIESIIWEAESANSITAPFVIQSDPLASGGQYIVNPAVGGASNSNPPVTNGIAKYNITLNEGGTYKLFLRVLCTTSGANDDSCYIRIQGATPSIVTSNGWTNCNNIDGGLAAAATTVWFWAQARQYDSEPGTLITFDIPKGSTTIEIAYREDGLKIDQLVLTNDPDASTTNLPLPISSKPNPANNATDVSLNTKLWWKPGVFAETFNVFIGTDFNDVMNATVSAHDGVELFEALDVNNMKPGMLEYGVDYYWRVDDIGTTTNKGSVWKFTAEPEGAELAVKNVLGVEAFAPQGAVYEDQEPNTTYNGSGVDANGMHSNDAKTMWAGVGDGPGDVWLQYELDQIYKLFQLKIWNYNEIEPGTPFGPKDVNITYSIDNVTWKALDEIQVFPKASGESTYEADIFVDMNGAIAKYVRLTFLSSYTDDLYTGGISEIRFLVIPTRASKPSPATDAANVNLDSIISWESGRDADIHKIYISYDKASVDNRDIDVMNETADSNYPIALDLNKTYYWRVDEVNNAEAYAIWDGPVWKFSTQQYVVVDNFDSGYGNDTAADAVFLTWKDAGELGNTSVNGSWMGRKSEPYLQTINHSSSYSAPMEYDNALVSYSEVKAETSMLDIGSDWSKGNPTSMEIWFRADANDVNEPVTDKLYASLSGGSRIYFDGDPSAIRKTIWTKFEVPLTGVNLTNVTSVTIGVEKIGSTGGKGVIYIDDIRLGVIVEGVDSGTDNLIARYEMEGNVLDTSGSGFNGTVFGIENGGLTYEAGKHGNALVFDGNNDYVTLPIGETLGTLSSCTISTWVNYGGGSSWQRIFDFGNDTNVYMYLSPNNNASAVRFAITKGSNGAEDGGNSSSVLSTGNWEHLAVVIDGDNGTVKLYRNGDLAATDDTVRALPKDLGPTTNNYLGKSNWTDPAFKGKIDDFRIYDRALSAGEVKYLYKN